MQSTTRLDVSPPPTQRLPAPRVDCHNCGLACANVVPITDSIMEPGLYCSVCDAGPLDEAED